MTECLKAPSHEALLIREPRAVSQSAFTLIEILVVVLITGLLAASASLALVSSARAATLDDLARRITFLDATARHTARRSGQAQDLVFDLDKGLIRSYDRSSDRSQDELISDDANWTQEVFLPAGFHLDHLWVLGRSSDEGAESDTDVQPTVTATREDLIIPDALGHTEGQIIIPCSADGYTPSYALSATGPQQQRRWITVTGLTAESSIQNSDKQVRSFLCLQSYPLNGIATTQPAEGHS